MLSSAIRHAVHRGSLRKGLSSSRFSMPAAVPIGAVLSSRVSPRGSARLFSSKPPAATAAPAPAAAAAAAAVAPTQTVVQCPIDVVSMLALSKFASARRELEKRKETKALIPVAEFNQLCAREGLTTSERDQLLEGLRKTKTVLWVPATNGGDFIYLHPDKVHKSILLMIDPEGMFHKQKQEKLEALKKEFQELDAVYGTILAAARKTAKRKTWGAVVVVTAQLGFLARLTWWELSWDIMEPITFFITMGLSVCGMCYVAFRGNEYSYEGMFNKFKRKRIDQLIKEMKFNTERHAALPDLIREYAIDVSRDMYSRPPTLNAASEEERDE